MHGEVDLLSMKSHGQTIFIATCRSPEIDQQHEHCEHNRDAGEGGYERDIETDRTRSRCVDPQNSSAAA
jgi:hypothetical protein